MMGSVSPPRQGDLVENGNCISRSLLPALDEEHGGVIVEMKEPVNSDSFLTILRASLSAWRHQGKTGVWIKLPISLVHLVETAVKEGFKHRHAEPAYLMLVYWIPETPSTIPSNASHRIGIGAIVLNGEGELLVVQEKSGVFQGTGVWKIPTGVVEEGEDIWDAAEREVKEETGIDTKFLEILAFRETHKTFFEKSDLFFVCVLRPISFDIQMQELEIEAAQWMPFKEYAAQPIAQKNELFKYITDLCSTKVERNYTGFSPIPIKYFGDQISYWYLNTKDWNQSNYGDRHQEVSFLKSSIH